MGKITGYLITAAIALVAVWVVANLAPASISTMLGLNPPARRMS